MNDMQPDNVMDTIGSMMPNSELLFVLAAGMNFAHNPMQFLYPIFFLVMVGVIFLATHNQKWTYLADDHKWWSRSILFLLMMSALILATGSSNWIFYQMQGKLSPEFPSTTGTAAKLDLYQSEFRLQLEARIPPEQKDLYDCVVALGKAEGNAYSEKCTDDPTCVHPVPKMSKEDIYNEIRFIQTGQVHADEQMRACYRVKTR
jgi:hypothetical protein